MGMEPLVVSSNLMVSCKGIDVGVVSPAGNESVADVLKSNH